MVRTAPVDDRGTNGNRDVAGTLTLLYTHDKPNGSGRVIDFQYLHHFVSSLADVHPADGNCQEAVVLRGKSLDVRKVAEPVLRPRGFCSADW